MRIILASRSPRRKELLNTIGIEPLVLHPDADENMHRGESVERFLERVSRSKVDSVYRDEYGDSLIIGCDTVVVCGNAVMGKPRDRNEAFGFLKDLSGEAHDVLTGLHLRYGERRSFKIEKTSVFFSSLSEDEIHSYLDHGEYWDKAGAYGIQGRASIFIHRIEGCYFNVVGFPLSLFYRMTKSLGVASLRVVAQIAR